jgi:ABC-type polysaccharide/polyol phosphate transport system ATPase subunit
MAQYVYTMRRVGKTVPPRRAILKDISLSFFPGAKIGVLGLNGAGEQWGQTRLIARILSQGKIN